MIYGLNFNNTHIPEAMRRKFAKRIRMTDTSTTKRVWFTLQGVCNSAEERDAMLIQANNGHRKLHVETRHTAAGDLYGIYVY